MLSRTTCKLQRSKVPSWQAEQAASKPHGFQAVSLEIEQLSLVSSAACARLVDCKALAWTSTQCGHTTCMYSTTIKCYAYMYFVIEGHDALRIAQVDFTTWCADQRQGCQWLGTMHGVCMHCYL